MHRRTVMTEDLIKLSQLNDFIFCPASIYFHNLYGNQEKYLYQTTSQVNGSDAHKTIDESNYSTRASVLTSLDVYCEEYGITGRIDILDVEKKQLTERKKHIKTIYDGYIFQLYGQYYALKEMGYDVEHLRLHSLDDNKIYDVLLPDEDEEMKGQFEALIDEMHCFEIASFEQTNATKCENCIYEPACDRGLL